MSGVNEYPSMHISAAGGIIKSVQNVQCMFAFQSHLYSEPGLLDGAREGAREGMREEGRLVYPD